MILILIFLSFFIFRSSSFAYSPIIIEKSVHAPPSGSGSDQNFVPNDINNSETIKCVDTYEISETFNPKQVGSTPPTYQEYNVNQIKNQVNFGINNYTNSGLIKQQQHLGNRLNKIIDTPQNIAKAFLSLDINNNSSNATNRSTPYYVLKCLRGQRLVKAIESLSSTYNGTTCNEQIGWNCQDSFVNLQDPHSSTCTPVRIADIAAYFAQKPIFYSPQANCYDTSLQPTTLNLDHQITPPDFTADIYQKLLIYGVEATDTCSLARNIEICDKDSQGNDVNCRKESSSIPRGSIVPSSQKIVSQFIPSSAKLIKPDICQPSKGKASFDRPNQVSFLGTITKSFGTVFDNSKTFSGSIKKTVEIDNRLDPSQDITYLLNMVPASLKAKYNLTSCSTTDGKTIDPGCSEARAFVSRLLLD